MSRTVQQLADELNRALIHKERKEGETITVLKDDSPQWMTDVIYAVHGDSLPDDTIYRFIERAADALAESSWTDELEEAIHNIEPDCYTSDLTAWLHERNDHVYYLTEVMEEFGGDLRDGFQLLGAAQQAHIQEIGFKLLEELRRLEAEQPDWDDPQDCDFIAVTRPDGVVVARLNCLSASDYDYWYTFDHNDYEPINTFVEVEYDLDYWGGNYDDVGESALIPLRLINELGDVETAFEQHTGIDKVHIIFYQDDVLYTWEYDEIL